MSLAAQRASINRVIGTALLHTPWLRRLEGISFLGTLDHHPKSRRASSRYEHSIGVAGLGAQVAELLELKRPRARTFVAACLLHDVGHYPLSHTAEAAFTRVLGADHHQLTRWIIAGEGPIDEARSLRPVLEKLDVDPDEVWALIDGTVPKAKTDSSYPPGQDELAQLLHARINLDTFEGIFRVAKCFRVRGEKLAPEVFCLVDGELSISGEALATVDNFWGLKDRVYDEVINLPSNILAEARISELVAERKHEGVFEGLEHFDDVALSRSLGASFDEARLRVEDDGKFVLSNRAADSQVLVRKRKRYFVDQRVGRKGESLSYRRWSERYQHERIHAFLLSRERQLSLPGVRDEHPPVYEAPEI